MNSNHLVASQELIPIKIQNSKQTDQPHCYWHVCIYCITNLFLSQRGVMD